MKNKLQTSKNGLVFEKIRMVGSDEGGVALLETSGGVRKVTIAIMFVSSSNCVMISQAEEIFFVTSIHPLGWELEARDGCFFQFNLSNLSKCKVHFEHQFPFILTTNLQRTVRKMRNQPHITLSHHSHFRVYLTGLRGDQSLFLIILFAPIKKIIFSCRTASWQ